MAALATLGQELQLSTIHVNLCDFLVKNMCMFLGCSSWFMKEILASL